MGDSLPLVAAEINRVTQVQVMMEFVLPQQWQTLALMSNLPLIEIWIGSHEGELGWMKNMAPGIFAFSNLYFWPLLSTDLMEYI